jgi:hypothetical protein
MDKIKHFNSLSPKEQCEWILNFVWYTNEDELRDFSITLKTAKSSIEGRNFIKLLKIVKRTKNIQIYPVSNLDTIIPLWIQKIRKDKLKKLKI